MKYFTILFWALFAMVPQSTVVQGADANTTSVQSAQAAANGMYMVKDFGAKGDGVTKDTAAIQKAVDACTAAGGGTVCLTPGTYLSGSIYLKNNVDFYLQQGAMILGSPDGNDYNPADVCPQNTASKLEVTSGKHLILCIEQKNVTVRGPGKINGNCRNCTVLILDKNGKKLPGHAGLKWRPAQMLYFVESENITLKDIELVDSPYWSCFIHGCTQVQIQGVRISTRRGETHNGDGIDIDCCQNVTVSHCRFHTSDDSLTLRANAKRLKHPQECRNITVTNCVLSSGQACIRVGVGNGKIHDAVFSNLVFEESNMGICLCPGWGKDGTDIRNIRFDNIAFQCARPFMLFFYCETPAKIEDIYFSNISGQCTGLSMFLGTPKNKVNNIHFSNIEMYHNAIRGKAPFEAFRIDGLTMENFRIHDVTKGKSDQPGTIRLGAVTNFVSERCQFTPVTMSEQEQTERDTRRPTGY
ncbi:MAG: glycosyl hydrolase family 28 protein [Planctomycetia bacterium]|nr:glycosyl hydrolase family 28 protein [Planctomycetia bacterium]